MLEQSCREEEVTKSIKEMGPYKSPGPDSFQGVFFHHTRNTMGQEVTTFIKRVMAGDQFPPGLAEVLLVLGPKIEHPISIT